MPTDEDNPCLKLVGTIYSLLQDAKWCLQPENPLAPSLMKILTGMCLHLSYSQMEELVRTLDLDKGVPEKAVEGVLRFIYTMSSFYDDVENCTWKNLFHFLEGAYTEANRTIWVAEIYAERIVDSEWDAIISFLPGMIEAEIEKVRR